MLAKKRRGPPATGKGVQVVVRLQPDPLGALDKWAAKQADQPTRAEAIRRLVELGLEVTPRASPSERLSAARSSASAGKGQKLCARDMAGTAIDRMTDTTAPPGDQASRKRRLLRGPEEFSDVRVDRPKAKGK